MNVISEQIDVSEAGEERESSLIALGAAEGFYRQLGDRHSALYSERGKTLLVTFENLDHVVERSADSAPWGYGFAKSKNWSMLGLMAHEWSWYRDDHVLDFFDELRDTGFFAGFDRVIFYGASMGAYAACAFSAASPGAEVIAISPQATLNRDIAGWETRYRKAWRRDFSGRYGFAPDQLQTASRALIVYDPASPMDAMHAALLRGPNVEHIRCRFMGHRMMSLWAAMGVLKPAVECLMAEEIDHLAFRKLMRARKDAPRYQKEMLIRLTDLGRDDLTVRLCRFVLSQRRAPMFRRQMREATLRLQKQKRRRA